MGIYCRAFVVMYANLPFDRSADLCIPLLLPSNISRLSVWRINHEMFSSS